MSDRKNRDLGRKRNNQQHRKYCGCWLCMEDPEKKRILEERAIKKELKQTKLGLDNI